MNRRNFFSFLGASLAGAWARLLRPAIPALQSPAGMTIRHAYNVVNGAEIYHLDVTWGFTLDADEHQVRIEA